MGGPKLEFMLPEYYNNIMQSDYVEKKKRVEEIRIN